MNRTVHLSHQRGVGLIELLVALAIGGMVLGLAAAFFGQQARVSRDTQARNEINIRARAVGEAILQDLRMAGARAVVDSDGRVVFRSVLPCDPDPENGSLNSCVTVRDGTDSATVDFALEVYYVSSLFLTGDGTETGQVCRRVTYELAGSTLFRSDTECANGVQARSFATEFASDVSSITLSFVCNDAGAATANPQDCFGTGDGFVREGQVSVDVGSPRDARQALQFESATAMLNMRAANRFAEAP